MVVKAMGNSHPRLPTNPHHLRQDNLADSDRLARLMIAACLVDIVGCNPSVY